MSSEPVSTWALPPCPGADAPHAMIDDEGDYFYPDNPEDADLFMLWHGARWVHEPPDWYVNAGTRRIGRVPAGSIPRP